MGCEGQQGRVKNKMIKAILAAGVLAGLTLGAAAPAQADSITFKVRSFHKFSVDMKFYSKSRNNIWPSATSHWTIKDFNVKDYKLTCVRGERICYGAATSGSGRMSWGVGLSGKAGCKNCCWTCGGDTTTPIINLNEV
jgi:hypothetical protein